ncbi:metallophosphoesterase family protein [Methylopila henanensis]|uniref:Metallophosphoesterase family protein n=1 Tax=Methylopila henanensis TaxID=873516 RepID=A0ABW4KD68_9HYPH
MRLYAISDLHLGSTENRETLSAITPRPDDWLAIAGDVGETEEHLRFALDALGGKFARLIWTPGNHELWSLPPGSPRGRARYERMVELCQARGALTPEDDYPLAAFGGRTFRVAPLFTLYDYSFRPDDVPFEQAVAWAREAGVRCADEIMLDPAPHPDRPSWCRERCDLAERRLRAACADGTPTVLINHWPLLSELVRVPRAPRFSLWCGTRRTADWPRRFRAEVVISGHLHMRGTTIVDGVRYEEVSLGYPQQWRRRIAPDALAVQVLG